ncbi:MAG: phage gp6-like head-tail connector protein [Provencibacterium sp.]|jgi:hypothetical protein|nr:phage gp6-like head-tail connector protein [Provencibacterium sp.]
MIALASNALTTLETVKALLPDAENSPSGEKLDGLLTLLINAASAWVETMTGRQLALQAYTERHAASGSQELLVNQYPIIGVEYIRDLQGGLVPPEEYDFADTAEQGIIYKESCWPYRGYVSGLANDYTASARYLEIRYTAGYVLPKDATEEQPRTLPYDLESLVWGIVGQEYMLHCSGAQGLSAFSISDVSWTFDKTPRQEWLDTIRRYMRW